MKTILIIEDDDQLRRMLVATLTKEGYEVRAAQNGVDGMARFNESKPDLVITDLIMPQKEGLETIQEMKLQDPKIKILAISGGSPKAEMDFLPLAKRFG